MIPIPHRSMRTFRIPAKWTETTAIPFDAIAEFLSDDGYEKYKDLYKTFAVRLVFVLSPEDRDTGLSASFDFESCAPLAEYPPEIIQAINIFCRDLPTDYYTKAYEHYEDYCDYLLNGDI